MFIDDIEREWIEYEALHLKRLQKHPWLIAQFKTVFFAGARALANRLAQRTDADLLELHEKVKQMCLASLASDEDADEIEVTRVQ